MVTGKRLTQAALTALIPILLACGQQVQQKDLNIDIKPELLQIVTDILPSGVVGVNYQNPDGTAVVIAVQGGTMPYQWAITAGALPAGISLTADTGTLFGKPTTTGNYVFTVTVTDSSGSTASIRVVGKSANNKKI